MVQEMPMKAIVPGGPPVMQVLIGEIRHAVEE